MGLRETWAENEPVPPARASAVQGRALGALYGLAIGDALGMPTETLSRVEVRRRYGEVTGFLPGDGNRVGLPAGLVTDDTEQAVIVARLLIEGAGGVNPGRLVSELLDWQQQKLAEGRNFLLGPSTQRALAAARAGVPLTETGREGTTNGAAMRIAPVGIAEPPEPLQRLADTVVTVDTPTHATGLAHAGAVAVAAAVSSGVAGASWRQSYSLAITAARGVADRGFPPTGEVLLRRLVDLPRTLDAISDRGLGVATEESVPAAFALAALVPQDPWRVGLLAAGLGGDSDTIGAMAAAMAGAHTGVAAMPRPACETVRRVNSLDLEALAADLLVLRAAAR
ncbi:MAG: ADP-ribosylglycohydrolase family protein [Frankiaceae bacterium]